MNLKHLNNLKSYPSFVKKADAKSSLLNKAINLALGSGDDIVKVVGQHGDDLAKLTGTVAKQGDDIVSLAGTVAKHGDDVVQYGHEIANLTGKVGQQGNNIKTLTGKVGDLARTNRNWRWGTVAAIPTTAALTAGGTAYALNNTTPPDHSKGGLNLGNSKGGNNGGDSKDQGEELDWIDEAATKISEFYEKHPGVAWGGTGLVALGGLYGLYNALEDEDEDEDY